MFRKLIQLINKSPNSNSLKQSNWCYGLRCKRVVKHTPASSYNYKRALCWTEVSQRAMDRCIWAMLKHKGMEWWRLWWLGHHNTELCPLPGACQGAVLSSASELFLKFACCSGLQRCVGSILGPSAPSKSGCRAHRITGLGPLRGDILRREVFSCVYKNTIL